MMVSLVLVISFLSLSLLHFAWALGVKWGFESVLPTDLEGNRVLNPKMKDSLIVGIGLGLFSVFYYLDYAAITIIPHPFLENAIYWLIPTIFLFRSIGDFKYVGFFKKIKTTRFGKSDTRYFAPLCLTIAVLGYFLAIVN
ncbi:MAG: DUF3995 domain-containing protein [Bacteroidota bacterium]